MPGPGCAQTFHGRTVVCSVMSYWTDVSSHSGLPTHNLILGVYSSLRTNRDPVSPLLSQSLLSKESPVDPPQNTCQGVMGNPGAIVLCIKFLRRTHARLLAKNEKPWAEEFPKNSPSEGSDVYCVLRHHNGGDGGI